MAGGGGGKAKKATTPNCVNYSTCGQQAKGPRAKYCAGCFRANAVLQGGKSSGNASASGSRGNAGNASTNRWKGGNASASGNHENAGNACASGNRGNAGNASASGKRGNSGNVEKGKVKKGAGKRSGVRRSAKTALVVKKKWLDLILAGLKTWEVRARPTAKRGWIHLAESQAGGELKGRARLVDCQKLTEEAFNDHREHHCIPRWDMVPYKKPCAWVFKDAEKFEKPFLYDHKQGAVVWVHV